VDVWRRCGEPYIACYHMGPIAAVLLVAAMAVAGKHWFNGGQPPKTEAPAHQPTPAPVAIVAPGSLLPKMSHMATSCNGACSNWRLTL